MADLKSKTILCIDSGNFFSFAQRMAREDGFGRVLYWSDVNPPLPRLHEMSVGDGFDDVQRIESPFDVLDQVDCFAFPDCTQPWMQRWLRNHKKPVWGSGGGVFLEWHRIRFRKILEELGLPVRPFQKVMGLSELRDALKNKTNMVVRASRFRGNLETFLWYDDKLSSGELDRIAVELGPLQEDVAFLIEKAYDATEVGYDGIFTGGKNGHFPESAFHGIEVKDKSGFGELVKRTDLPHPIAAVLEKFEPILRDLDYSNNFHAEIRVVDDERFYFTDPTCRMASPMGEPLLEAIANFPQVVWEGAHERFLEPDWQYKYAAQVLIEHKDDGRNRWRTIRVPNEIERWVKLCDVCKTGEELYSFPPLPHSNNKVGSVLGMGQTPEEAVEQLKSHVEALGKQDITIDLSKLAEAISEGIEGQGEATEIADESGAESAKSLAQV